VFFRLFSHLRRNENEIKRKNVYFVSLLSKTKTSEAKRKNLGSETKRKYALLISLWSEAKRSEKNFFLHERVKRMQNGSRFASFCFEAKFFFCETGTLSVPDN
jgi:hypothetical protein